MKAQQQSSSIATPTRRDALKFGSAAIASGLAPGWALAATDEYISGIVFEDHAGDGLRRDNARGIPGVLISNGVDVVRSGEGGHYRLPLRNGHQSFVVKPAGYDVRLAPGTNLPLHYLAQLQASHEQQDFALVPNEVTKQFDAILMADPQPGNHRHLDHIRDAAVPLFAKSKVALGLTLGDIVGDELSLLRRYNSLIGQAGTPWWNAGGNHDLDYKGPDHFHARAPFREAFGPATFAFEQGQALFIVLDNVEYTGCTPDGGIGRYRGAIGPRQLTFVRNLLAHIPMDKLIVLAMHIPLRTDWNPLSTRDNTADADALLRLLSGRRAVSFSGQMHATEHQYLQYGETDQSFHHHQVLAALSGSWWSGPYDHRGRPLALGVDGCPPGFHVLQVDGVDYSTRFVPLTSQEAKMRIVLSRCSPCSSAGNYVIDGPAEKKDMPCEIIANVFDGGPRTKVRMRLPGGEWRDLQRVRRVDPFMIDYFAEAGAIRHDWVKAEPCEHLWSAAMPLLRSGIHRVEIEVRDEYARLSQHIKIIEIADAAI